MIKGKKKILFTGIGLLLVFFLLRMIFSPDNARYKKGQVKIIKPAFGSVALTLDTTGVVEPQNRLEIKPSIGGRIERILVNEGDKVKTGQVLAWMSSSERAALIDMARSQGEEAVKYWEDVYKMTPIVSPIDGEVIVRSVEPGQTISTAEAILVLSDRLVIKAQFDETDIRRVKAGNKAFIKLDAYPDVDIEGTVNHIAYESQIINNVTIYEADILPALIPEFLRSGMSVTVEVVEKQKDNVLTIPSGAIYYEGGKQFVMAQNGRGNAVKKEVKIGLNNDRQAEVISGVSADDNILIQENLYTPAKKPSGSNPFMPSRKK